MARELKLGKRDATLDDRDLQFAAYLPGLKSAGLLPKLPKVFGHGNDFLGEGWLMLGNGPDDTVYKGFEGCGDCAWADPAHATMAFAKNSGHPVPRFTGKVIVDQYSEYCGYNPKTGAKDEGSDLREVLAWRQKKGLRDADGKVHKIGHYMAISPKSIEDLMYAVYLLEGTTIGIEFPESADQQFAEGKPWDVVKGAEIVGGHDIYPAGRPNEESFAAITWAKRQPVTNRFYAKYNDESFGYVSAESLSSVTGKTYEGQSAEQLEQYLTQIAKLKAAA